MSGLFTSGAGRDPSPARTEAGEDVEEGPSRGAGGVKPSGGKLGGAWVERAHEGRILKGKGPVAPDPRKYRYDVTRGRAAKVAFEVTRDDRMSAEDAGRVLHEIHEMFGVAGENHNVLHAFDSALWFCHTVNGGSVLQPGRSTFMVPGLTRSFDMANVRDKLGVDARRFFRAFADDIASVNKEVLDSYDPYHPVKAEAWGWLQQVAYARGLHRHPYLAHDSADACINLNAVERAALAASKVMVISTSANSADRLKANDRVMSLDNYDSTVGTSI